MLQLILAALAAAVLGGAAAEEKLYTLDAIESSEAVYFYNASDGALVFEKRAADTKKDPSAGFGHSTLVERTNVVVHVDKKTGTVRGAVQAWRDRKGHARTLEVLKRQVSFAREKERHQGCRPSVPCPVIPFSGILERETVRIPYYQALFRLSGLADRFQKECNRVTQNRCGKPPYGNAILDRAYHDISTAGGDVRRLGEVLDGVTLGPPSAGSAVLPYPLEGLEAPLPPSGELAAEYALRSYVNATKPRELRIVPAAPGPGGDVTESVDPAKLDGGTLQRVADAANDARKRLDETEKVLEDLGF